MPANQRRFQSTPPARGATSRPVRRSCSAAYFNPRPPRGGRLKQVMLMCSKVFDFNPRPPRGGRHLYVYLPRTPQTFQSTPPARGATPAEVVFPVRCTFQSTPPARGATITFSRTVWIPSFQSTPPARGATAPVPDRLCKTKISIHAPREGGDCCFQLRLRLSGYFNPRPPRGGRLV